MLYGLTIPSRDFPIIRQSGPTNCGPTSRSSRSLRSVIEHQIIRPVVFTGCVIYATHFYQISLARRIRHVLPVAAPT
jgi:hypothetical protein